MTTKTRKTTKKSKIISLKKRNPKRTLESIGNEIGVSREYIRQVLQEAGVESGKEQPSCYECSTLLYPSKARPYIDLKTGHKYCRTCRHNMVWGTYSCKNCGVEVVRRKRDILRATPKYIFCTKTCQGQYIGKTYGKGATKKAFKTALKDFEAYDATMKDLSESGKLDTGLPWFQNLRNEENEKHS